MDTNPYDIKYMLDTHTIDTLEQDPVYVQAQALAQAILDLYSWTKEHGTRYDAKQDQLERASSSVAANYAQGWAKCKGHLLADWLVSRAELYETYAYLTLMPAPFKALLPQARDLIKDLDAKIKTVPEKPPERWKNWGN